MRSYDEMAQNVFRRGDEYFQKKQKQAAFIKKGVSFMSITGIIIALGLVAGSTQLLSPSIPDEPQQIDLNTGITTETVTSTAETAEASVTSTSASATAAASAEVTVTADTTTEAFTVTTTVVSTAAKTAQTTETTAVTTAAVGTTTTEDIVSDTESSPFTAPEGYEEHAVLSNGVIFKKPNEFSIYFLHGFQYNLISLKLSGAADWDNIYNEYWADLGFDYAGGSAYSAMLYDKKEAAGDPRTPTDIEDKLEAAADVCAEMYKAGLLESAEYTKILATLNYGMYERSFNIKNFSGTSDELQQLADGMYEDILINVYGTEDAPEYYVDFTEADITYDEAMEVCDAIESTFAGCSVLESFHYNEDWNPISTDPIDLLADMQEETENSDLIDSGTFGEIFSWSFSDGTLTFTVDDSAKTGGDICLTTGLDYSEGNQAENRPWFSYIHDIRHIVFDAAITSIGTDIVFDFMAIDTTTAIETVTCGENMRWDENIWAYYNDTSSAVLRAPEYSYSDYWAFYEIVPFEATGTAQDPYLKLSDENGTWVYSDDTSALTIHGDIDAESLISVSEMWYGRYDQVILSEDTVCGSDETSYFITHVLAGGTLHKDMRRDDITVSCYSSLGADNISSIRAAGYTVVVLDGEAAVMTGDVDGSGKVDITDASIALTIYSRRSVWIPTDMYTDEMHIRADVDGDGLIALSDAAYILHYFTSNAVSIPVTWDEILNA